MRTTNVRQHLKGTYTDMADPQVAKAASGLTIGKQSTSLRHRSSTSHKDSLRLQRQREQGPSPRPDPIELGFPHGRTLQLDARRPGRPSTRPTEEASEAHFARAPFQPPAGLLKRQVNSSHPFNPLPSSSDGEKQHFSRG